MGALVSKASVVPMEEDLSLLKGLTGELDSMGGLFFLTQFVGVSGYELNTLQHQRAMQEDLTQGGVHMKAQRKGGGEEEEKEDRHSEPTQNKTDSKRKSENIFLSTLEHSGQALHSLSVKISEQVCAEYQSGAEETQHPQHCCNSCGSSWQSKNSRCPSSPHSSGGSVEYHCKKTKCSCVSCTQYLEAWNTCRLTLMCEYVSVRSHLDYLLGIGSRIVDTKEAQRQLGRSLKKYAVSKVEQSFMRDKLTTWETILARSVIKFHKQTALMMLWADKFKKQSSQFVSYLQQKLFREEQVIVKQHVAPGECQTACNCVNAWKTMMGNSLTLSTLYGNTQCSIEKDSYTSAMEQLRQVEQYMQAPDLQDVTGPINWARVYNLRWTELGREQFVRALRKYQFSIQYPCQSSVLRVNNIGAGGQLFSVSSNDGFGAYKREESLQGEREAYAGLECAQPHQCPVAPAVCQARENHRGILVAAVAEVESRDQFCCSRWQQNINALDSVHRMQEESQQKDPEHVLNCVGNTMSLYPGCTLLGETEVATLQISFLLLDEWGDEKVPLASLPFQKTEANVEVLRSICKKKYIRNGLQWPGMRKVLSRWASELYDLQQQRDEQIQTCQDSISEENDDRDDDVDKDNDNDNDDDVDKDDDNDNDNDDDDDDDDDDDEQDNLESIQEQEKRNAELQSVSHKLVSALGFLPSILYGTYSQLDRVIAAHKTPHSNFRWVDSQHSLHRMYNCVAEIKFERGTLLESVISPKTRPHKLSHKAKEIRYDFFKLWSQTHAPKLHEALVRRDNGGSKCSALSRFERITEDFHARQQRRDQARGVSEHSHVQHGTEGYVAELELFILRCRASE